MESPQIFNLSYRNVKHEVRTLLQTTSFPPLIPLARKRFWIFQFTVTPAHLREDFPGHPAVWSPVWKVHFRAFCPKLESPKEGIWTIRNILGWFLWFRSVLTKSLHRLPPETVIGTPFPPEDLPVAHVLTTKELSRCSLVYTDCINRTQNFGYLQGKANIPVVRMKHEKGRQLLIQKETVWVCCFIQTV